MNGNINTEAVRPRPLSGGIWTLFSWLRRDENSVSSDSLSSAGSDRTAASFAFLEPFNYKTNTEPIVLPPLGPPTDSYKKRVRDKNFRKRREHGLTLHRKYGLFKGDETDRYDAFSLPSAHRNILENVDNIERGRRATSEIFQRRAPYVPGKRRAPLPPAVSNSLPRSFSRKRQAPKPPNDLMDRSKLKMQLEDMNTKTDSELRSSNKSNINVTVDVKNERFESQKHEKIKADKNFLKQLFENRKRNSAIESNYVKLLPNISELDKQAAKIVEKKKLKLLQGNVNMPLDNMDSKSSADQWICTICLRKYDAAVSSCLYCVRKSTQLTESSNTNLNLPHVGTNIYTQTDQSKVASSSKQYENDDKKKLKEMLKEMKHSLPKKSKPYAIVSESPTLRIGSSLDKSSVESKSNAFVKISDNAKTQLNIKKNVDVVTSNQAPPHSEVRTDIETEETASQIQTINNENKRELSPKMTKNNIQEKDLQVGTKSESKTYLTNHEISVTNGEINVPLIKINLPKSTNEKSGDETTRLNNSSHLLLKTQIGDLNSEKKQQVQSEFNQANNSSEVHTETHNKNDAEVNTKNSLLINKDVQIKAEKDFSNLKPKSIPIKSAENFCSNILKTTPDERKAEKSVRKKLPTNSSPNEQSTNVHFFKLTHNENTTILENSKDSSSSQTSDIHTPLRISSLLNPGYRPIQSSYAKKNEKNDGSNNINEKIKTSSIVSQHPATLSTSQKPLTSIEEISEPTDKERAESSSSKIDFNNLYNTNTSVCKVLGVTPSSSKEQPYEYLSKIDHHSRRRELVNQLEQSIAKGDEQSAADAAVKLAKLRLSCSVLSFSSQIIGNFSGCSGLTHSSAKPKESETNKALQSGLSEKNHQTQTDNKSMKQELGSTKSTITQTSTSISKAIENCDLKDKQNIATNDTNRETSKLNDNSKENNKISIQIWIEDKETTRGPISLSIVRYATMGDLRQQAETFLGLGSHLQRWIVGQTLCLEDTTPLVTLAGPDLVAPFYLCVVEPETNKEVSGSQVNEQKPDKPVLTVEKGGEVYTELMKLEQQAIVPNSETFVCEVCMDECQTGKGVVLRECLHSFCKECLTDVVRHCEEPTVSCPTMGCPGVFQDREIRALLSTEEYERWLARGLATAECGTGNAFHCRTRDCTGWALCDPGVRKFPCPVCKCDNCVPCQAIHEDETCEQYQQKLRTAVFAAQTNETDASTQSFLNSLIRRGEALKCPECQAVITKKWGCDWVKCSACKTEICWVTRGRRWGPGGRGDTSGGCRCGVDGKRCHPSCGYCH